MTLREKITEITGIPESHVPGSYQVIGQILLVKFNAVAKQGEKKKIAQAALKIMPSVKSAYEQKSIVGELRKPGIRYLAGEKNTKTIHNENGIRYSIDVSKVMFSKGNLFERQRIIREILPGETVLDMFAGIGYFSLGVARFSEAKEVISVEKNPESFRLLKENININRIKNMTAVQGDCRKISGMKEFSGIADRVIMGYLPGTSKFLPHAFRFLGKKGMVHYHDIFNEKDIWKKPVTVIKASAKKKGFSVKISGKKIVKSYAPRVWHVAVDFEARRNHSA